MLIFIPFYEPIIKTSNSSHNQRHHTNRTGLFLKLKYLVTSHPIIVHVSFEDFKVLRIAHEVCVDLEHQARDQGGASGEDVGDIQSEC